MTKELEEKDRLYVVTGATGRTGNVVAETLLAYGKRVRVIGRNPNKLQRFVRLGAEPFVAQPTDARATWSALFEPDAELYDDGSPRSLKEFTRDALGHERVTSIDRVENNGLDLTGAFHSDQRGDFQTYFRFQLSPAGKINRLDIRQAT